MKSLSISILSLIVFMGLLLSGCNMPSIGGSTQDPGLIFTEAAKTDQAVPTNTQPILSPTARVTQEPPTPTTISSPTVTPTTVPTTTPTTLPTPTAASCTDLAKFVDDVTIPDNSEMSPEQEYIKTWRLQNIGTCTWSSQYGITFISGDQMNGTSPLPLTGSVAPNGLLDVSITLKAPGTAGTYRGDWKLRNSNGVIFGTGANGDQTFYVQIKVVENISDLNLGNPTWTDNLNTADNWYLLDTPNTRFTEGDGKLVMTSLNPGAAEEWDISNQPSMQDYYLQATFITGSTCSGLDRYGLLARAPDPDKGYVFEFSCDGHYRLYTWDGKNYNALQEWTPSSSILAGTNQTNVMGIWMTGTTLRLYANGRKIAEFTDNMFDHGQFGLVIGSLNTDNFTVSVDQVSYWKFDH